MKIDIIINYSNQTLFFPIYSEHDWKIFCYPNTFAGLGNFFANKPHSIIAEKAPDKPDRITSDKILKP